MLLSQVVDWVGKSQIRQRAEVSFLLLESESSCRLVPGQIPCQKRYQEACVYILLMVARRKNDFFFRDIEILERKQNNNNNNDKEFAITFLPNPFVSHEGIGFSVITTSHSDRDTINI